MRLLNLISLISVWLKNGPNFLIAKRKQVGALIVNNRTIISDGYNGTPSGFENCCEDTEGKTHWYVLHAEANAILKLANSTQSCKGATLYLTLSPVRSAVSLYTSLA